MFVLGAASSPAAFSLAEEVGNPPVLGISFGFCQKLPAEDVPQSWGDNQLQICSSHSRGTPSLLSWGSSRARGGGFAAAFVGVTRMVTSPGGISVTLR